MPTVGHVRCAGGATMCGFSHGGLVAILLAMFAVISAGCASGAAATPNGPATLTPGGGQTQATSTVPATGDCSTFAPGHRIPWPIFPCPQHRVWLSQWSGWRQLSHRMYARSYRRLYHCRSELRAFSGWLAALEPTDGQRARLRHRAERVLAVVQERGGSRVGLRRISSAHVADCFLQSRVRRLSAATGSLRPV